MEQKIKELDLEIKAIEQVQVDLREAIKQLELQIAKKKLILAKQEIEKLKS